MYRGTPPPTYLSIPARKEIKDPPPTPMRYPFLCPLSTRSELPTKSFFSLPPRFKRAALDNTNLNRRPAEAPTLDLFLDLGTLSDNSHPWCYFLPIHLLICVRSSSFCVSIADRPPSLALEDRCLLCPPPPHPRKWRRRIRPVWPCYVRKIGKKAGRTRLPYLARHIMCNIVILEN